jgi:hypothetical protein
VPAWVRFLPHVGLALAIGFAIWWIDDNASDRTRMQLDAAATKIENRIREDLRGVEQRADEREASRGAVLTAKIDAIRTTSRTVIQPTVEKELTREIRYSDPAAGISPVLLEAVNRARALSSCAPTVGNCISVPLPAAGANP